MTETPLGQCSAAAAALHAAFAPAPKAAKSVSKAPKSPPSTAAAAKAPAAAVEDDTTRRTKFVQQAVSVAQLAMQSINAIAEITGTSGSGKTTAARHMARVLGGVRIACWDGMSRAQVLASVARALGIEGGNAAARLLDRAHGQWAGQERQLIVVDEANKLNWRGLEALRYLADECHCAIVLVGTELYERQFSSQKTRELLLQLGRRIGARRVRMGALDRAACLAHVITPWCGGVADAALVAKFWQACRRGNWGDAVELAAECQRLMQLHQVATLTAPVLEAAIAWSANSRVKDASAHDEGEMHEQEASV